MLICILCIHLITEETEEEVAGVVHAARVIKKAELCDERQCPVPQS